MKRKVIIFLLTIIALVIILSGCQERKVNDVFKLNATIAVRDMMYTYDDYLNTQEKDEDEFRIEILEIFREFAKRYDPREVDLTERELTIALEIAELRDYILQNDQEKVIETYKKIYKMLGY